MNMHIKITREIYDLAKQDLGREHPHAAERIGFFLAKVGSYNGEPELMLIHEYMSIADADYERNEMVGASIGSVAIRKIMQRILDTGSAAFHVHAHEFSGMPGLSFTDRESIPPLVKSFQNINPTKPHGIFLFSEDQHKGWVLPPGSDTLETAKKITVVGYPISTSKYA